MTVPHKGIALAYRRTYNSQSGHDVSGSDGSGPSLYGNGWTSTWDAHLSGDATHAVTVWDIDGARYDYTIAADGVTWQPPAGQHALLTWDQSCGFLWTKKSGTTYQFYTPAPVAGCSMTSLQYGGFFGRIHQIIGRNRNATLTFSYVWDNGDSSTAGKIANLTAFTESGMQATVAMADVNGHRLAASLSPPAGPAVYYGYDNGGNLTSVGMPPNDAGTTLRYQTYGYANAGSGAGYMAWAASPRWTASAAADGSYLYFGTEPFGNTTLLLGIGHTGYVNTPVNDQSFGGFGSVLQPGAPQGLQTFLIESYNLETTSATYSDSDGHMTAWTTDAQGRPLQTKRCTASANQGQQCTGLWLTTNESWDADDNLVAETDPRGNETDYAYDANGNTIAVAAPQTTMSQGRFRPTKLYDYDGFNNVTAYCDESQTHQAHADWVAPPITSDSLCSTAAVAAGAPYSRFGIGYPAYQSYGRITSMVTPMGYSRYIRYDLPQQGGTDYGLPTSVTGDPITELDDTTTPTTRTTITPTRTFWYDAPGNLRCYSNGSGTWVLSYDALSRQIMVADPDDTSANAGSVCGKSAGKAGWNTQTTSTYNPDGSLATAQTPAERARGVSSSFAYDADGNTVRETRHFGWNAGPVAAGTTVKWYDGADRLVEVAQPQDPADATYGRAAWLTRYLYDLSMGQSVSMPGSGISYQAYGNLFATEEWMPGFAPLKGQAFDALDRPAATYSFVPGTSGTTLNATALNYDASPQTLGLLSTKRDAAGTYTVYAYDERGTTSSVTYANDSGPVPTPPRYYTYDPNARVASVSNASYGTKVMQYDPDGRLTEVDEPTSGTLSSPAHITYHYYQDGSRKAVGVASSLLNVDPLIRYSYRLDGSSVSASLAYGGAKYGFKSSYTDAGRITARTDPSTGKAVPASSPAAIYAPTTWDYDSSGQLTTLSMPYGFAYTGIVHDPEGHIAGWRSSLGAAGDVISSFTNTVRGENIKEVLTPTNPGWRGGYPTPWNAAPVHGALAPVAPPGTDSYTPTVDPYNALVTGSSGSYSFRNVDGLYQTCATTSADQYDQASRLAARTTSDSCYLYSSRTISLYSYDAENHTTQVFTNGSAPCNIVWGPDGHAVQNPCPAINPSNNLTDSLHYDGEDVLFVTNSQNALTDIRVGTLGDLLLGGSTSPIFWVPDRDFAGVIATAHSNLGSDGITFGESTAWSGGGCRYGNSLTDPVPSCSQPVSGQTVSLTIGRAGNGANGGQNPPYANSHLDGIDWAPNVTLQGVRAKDTATGAWTTPDAYAGDVHDPMSQKPFMWNRNNPYAYSDPSGYCADPSPNGTGVRVCIDAFIQQPIVMGVYAGDDRSFSGNQSPDSYRVHADVNFATRAAHAVIGDSRVGGKSYAGTGEASAVFSADGKTATVHIEAHAGGPLNAPSPPVKADFTLSLSKDGTVAVAGRHTQFPSFEVYVYGGSNNGALYKYTENPKNQLGPFFLGAGENVKL